MRATQWITVRSELGAGTRGSSLGIDALMIAALDAGERDFFSRFDTIEVEDENYRLHMQTELSFGKLIGGISVMYDRISRAVSRSLFSNHFPVVLSGDHSSAGATISGLKVAYPDKRIGVIWIDAHADLHSPYTTPSGNVHGMPLAAVLGEDNMDCKRNDVEEATVRHWETLKNIGGISPKIQYEDLVYIGVRDTEEQEEYLIRKNGVKLIKIEYVNEHGTLTTVKNTLDYLKHCDMIYISFDVDSMDAGLAWGTGTPVANGLSGFQAKQLLTGLMKDPRVSCLELAEINPLLDVENQIARLTFPILKAAVEQMQETSLLSKV